jgi:putative transposase
VVRTFRYPLRPTPAQASTLLRWLGVCCDLYNAALQERRDAWRVARKNVSNFDQIRELVEVRRADEAIAEVPSEVARSALRRVDLSFSAFFRRCKSGQSPGYPRFRSRRRYESFSFPFTSVTGNRVHILKLGLVRFHRYRAVDGIPRRICIGREPTGKWYVSFVCDVGDAPAKTPVRSAIGIDLGLTTFATLSNGTEVANPRLLRAGEKLLTRRQRILSRRQRSSNSRERARVQVAKAYQHIHNQRKDFVRKLSVELFKKYDLIAHEDLEIRGLSRGRNAKSVRDAAWGMFLRCLASKAESAGKHVIAVDPRGTSQRCSGCGETVRKELSERIHSCPCGIVLGRDHNAALNILALGGSAVEAEKFSAVEAEGDYILVTGSPPRRVLT